MPEVAIAQVVFDFAIDDAESRLVPVKAERLRVKVLGQAK
jgi:hypothetical protein